MQYIHVPPMSSPHLYWVTAGEREKRFQTAILFFSLSPCIRQAGIPIRNSLPLMFHSLVSEVDPMLKKALLHCKGMFRTEKRGGKRGYIGLGPKYIWLFRMGRRTIHSYMKEGQPGHWHPRSLQRKRKERKKESAKFGLQKWKTIY